MSRWFSAPLSTMAFCWRLDRRDGITIGLTSHDHDVSLAGLVYRAAPGLVPSALDRSTGLDADSLELSGAISSTLLRADDLAAGRWDGAQLRLWAVDWTLADTDPVLLVRGQLGAVTLVDGKFTVDLLGPMTRLDAEVAETSAPHCRAQLGDRRCRVAMAGRVVLAQVTDNGGADLRVSPPLSIGDFAFGRLRWLDGPRAGLTELILSNAADTLTLADTPELGGEPRRVELTQGCDRRFATCVGRFGNGTNFRGEPHLPGNDLLVRYGG